MLPIEWDELWELRNVCTRRQLNGVPVLKRFIESREVLYLRRSRHR